MKACGRRASGIFENYFSVTRRLTIASVSNSFFFRGGQISCGRDHLRVKQHQRYCKRQSQADRSHKTCEGTNLK